MVWGAVVVWVASAVISSALAPRPPSVRAATASDLDVPRAKNGGEIGVLFGTDDIPSDNCVWYGHFKSKAVKSSGGKK